MIEITTDTPKSQEEFFEALSDKSSKGKERPWRKHKMASQVLSQALDELGMSKKAFRVQNCASWLQFALVEGKKHLASANFCGVRLCPMCSWRRSLRIGHDVYQVVEYLNERSGMRYLFLTLTLRNCSADDLGLTIDEMMSAWNRFIGYAEIEKAVKGWFRSFEVTHNLDEIGTANEYHPHFHVLLAVNSSYFKGLDYIRQSRFIELWQKALKISYLPSVNIKAVKGDLRKAVAEVSKYATKSGEVVIADDWELTVETVRLLTEVLFKRRLVAWGGVMKSAKIELDIPDEENADLVHTDSVSIPDGAPREWYNWFSNYTQYGKSNPPVKL